MRNGAAAGSAICPKCGDIGTKGEACARCTAQADYLAERDAAVAAEREAAAAKAAANVCNKCSRDLGIGERTSFAGKLYCVGCLCCLHPGAPVALRWGRGWALAALGVFFLMGRELRIRKTRHSR